MNVYDKNQKPGWMSGRKAIAEYTGQSPRTISRWIELGHLPVKRLGHKTMMIRPADLDRAIEKMAAEYAEGGE